MRHVDAQRPLHGPVAQNALCLLGVRALVPNHVVQLDDEAPVAEGVGVLGSPPSATILFARNCACDCSSPTSPRKNWAS
jgi:hypothetical protein